MGTIAWDASSGVRPIALLLLQSKTPMYASLSRDINRVTYLFLCVCVAILVPYGCSLTGRLMFRDGDCYLYAQIAQEWFSGKRLYEQVWLDKPPLAYLFYLPSQLVAPGSFSALQGFFGVWLVLQVLVVQVLAKPASRFGRIAAGLILALLPLTRMDLLWASTEGACNLFVMICLVVAFNVAQRGTVKNWECFAAGLAAAAAFHIRQNAVLMGLVPATMILFSPISVVDRFKALARMAAGGLTCLAAVILLMLWTGDLWEYINTVYLYPSSYAAASDMEMAPFLQAQWRTKLAKLLLIGLTAAMLTRMRLLACIAFLTGCACAFAPMKPFSHYLGHLIPVIALFMLILQETPTPAWRTVSKVAAVLLLAFLLRWAFRNLEKWSERDQLNALDEVAAVIDEHSEPGSNAFITGPMGPSTYLFFRTEVPASHAYHWDMLFDNYWSKILPRTLPVVMDEYWADPPELLVVDQEWLKTITTGQTVAKRPNTSRLIAGLLQRGDYAQKETLNGWVILMRGETSIEDSGSVLHTVQSSKPLYTR